MKTRKLGNVWLPFNIGHWPVVVFCQSNLR